MFKNVHESRQSYKIHQGSHENLAIAWIDNKKAYDRVLQSLIVDCQKCTRYQSHKIHQGSHENVAIAWIDNKKAYDRVLQSWIVDCQKCTRYQSHKIHHGSHEKLESGIDSRRKSKCKNPEINLPGRCVFL